MPYIISYVINAFNGEDNFTGNERMNSSLYHYNRVLSEYGIDQCRHILKGHVDMNMFFLPSLYMNFFYSNTMNTEDFPELMIDNYHNRDAYVMEKRKRLHSFINNQFDGKYVACYYNADDASKIENEDNIDKKNTVFVTGLLFNNQVNMKVLEAQKINKSLISPREYAINEKKASGLSFYSNFFYILLQRILRKPIILQENNVQWKKNRCR